MGVENPAFEVAHKDIVSEEFEGEFVVLDMRNGRYFALGGAAALLWRALAGGTKVSDVLDAVPQARRSEVQGFIDELVGHALLTPRETPAGNAAPAGLGTLEGDIHIQVFDDLAELLVADPIHDVDEQAGWPHRKA
jgi:hypothetical protein